MVGIVDKYGYADVSNLLNTKNSFFSNDDFFDNNNTPSPYVFGLTTGNNVIGGLPSVSTASVGFNGDVQIQTDYNDKMIVTPYKIAYMDSDDAYKLYSEFYETESQAKEREVVLKNKGYDAMRMNLVSNEGGDYVWSIDKASASMKYKIGTSITSNKFIVPFGIVLLTYLLLRKK